MKFSELYLLTESPDAVLDKEGNVLPWEVGTAFIIYKQCIMYGPQMTHSELADRFIQVIEKSKPATNFKNVNKIYIFNYDPQIINIKKAQRELNVAVSEMRVWKDLKHILSGRFWDYGRGYISFWAQPKDVYPHRKYVEQFITLMGFKPQTTWWEKYIPKIKDEDFVSYKEFFSSDVETDDVIRRRKEAKMMHLIPGAKRLLGKIIPKKITPPLSVVQSYQLGDTFDQLTKSTKRGKSCIVETYADLFEI